MSLTVSDNIPGGCRMDLLPSAEEVQTIGSRRVGEGQCLHPIAPATNLELSRHGINSRNLSDGEGKNLEIIASENGNSANGDSHRVQSGQEGGVNAAEPGSICGRILNHLRAAKEEICQLPFRGDMRLVGSLQAAVLLARKLCTVLPSGVVGSLFLRHAKRFNIMLLAYLFSELRFLPSTLRNGLKLSLVKFSVSIISIELAPAFLKKYGNDLLKRIIALDFMGGRWIREFLRVTSILSGLIFEALFYLFSKPLFKGLVRLNVVSRGLSYFPRASYLVPIVIRAPVCEELIFRKLLYGSMKKFFGSPLAAILSGLAFGSCHCINSQLPIAISGSILAMGYERCGSILAPMICHALWNFSCLL